MKTLMMIVITAAFALPSMAAIKSTTTKPAPINLKSPEGFALHNVQTDWFQAPAPADKKGIHMLFRAPKTNEGFQPVLTVRVDNKTGKSKNVKQYVNRWMGDYTKLGYEVLGAKRFKHQGHLSYVIDVRNPTSNKQVRQTVFFRNKKAVIMTCIDNVANFKKSLNECNKVIRSFAWNKVAKK